MRLSRQSLPLSSSFNKLTSLCSSIIMTPELFERRLLGAIDNAEKQCLLLGHAAHTFHQSFGSSFQENKERLGFSKFRTMVESFPSIEVFEHPNNQLYVRRSSQKKGNEEGKSIVDSVPTLISSRQMTFEEEAGMDSSHNSQSTTALLKLLKCDLEDELQAYNESCNLTEIVLDKGRRPLCWVDSERHFLGNSERVVDESELESILDNLSDFGTDNRVGMDGQLHRISAIRNLEGEVTGLTMRIGRQDIGYANMISDLLRKHPTPSILVLGDPGSGKTTLIRDISRLLAKHLKVMIVDTSNEIAGSGDVPHGCVGNARRMMVSSLDEQASVMIECVQNHTPQVMVIDEIGRKSEVQAALTCKNRGVCMVASAHGNLHTLIENPPLSGLLGGIERVIVTDANAGPKLKKLQRQRRSPPIFDMIVELRNNQHDELRIVQDVDDAVDEILGGGSYMIECRSLDRATGTIEISQKVV